MKKLFVNLAIFVFFFSLLFGGTSFVVSEIIEENLSFKLNKNSDFIIIGDSHPECAFNDSLIGNFSNRAKSGTSYFYSYFKVKQILQQNENIKAVFIEFNNSQIDENVNEWIWGDEILPTQLGVFFPFIDANSAVELLEHNPTGFANGITRSVINYLPSIVKNNYSYKENFFGKYLYLVRNKTDSLIAHRRNLDISKNALSGENLTYLDRIISHCKSNDVKVYLVRSPVHTYYKDYGNESKFRYLLKSRYKEVEFLDFSRFSKTNSEFGDPEHLNYVGARRFSIWFNELLTKGVLEARDKQGMIDRYLSVGI